MDEHTMTQEEVVSGKMWAARVHEFGGLDALTVETIPVPTPGKGQVLVRVAAAGVGNWDALIRAGGSKLQQPLPLTLGSDFAGVVVEVGSDVGDFHPGDEVFGVTNPQFTGAQAEYAVAEAGMITRKPAWLNDIEAASLPVVTITAWQMVFQYGQVIPGKRVLVHGGAGNVGAYAVQFAKWAGAEVIATAFPDDVEYVYSLGADQVIDAQFVCFEERVKDADVALDTVGGETLDRSFAALKPGGVLVSSVAMPDQEKAARDRVHSAFFYVEVTTEALNRVVERLTEGQLITQVGEILPLTKVRLAHEMLAGKPHKRGKIVLRVDA